MVLCEKKEERHSGEQQTEAGTLPQKYAERTALRRRCGMAGEQLSAQPEDGAREQRVGNALQRGDGEPGNGDDAHAKARDPNAEQHGKHHICC